MMSIFLKGFIEIYDKQIPQKKSIFISSIVQIQLTLMAHSLRNIKRKYCICFWIRTLLCLQIKKTASLFEFKPYIWTNVVLIVSLNTYLMDRTIFKKKLCSFQNESTEWVFLIVEGCTVAYICLYPLHLHYGG